MDSRADAERCRDFPCVLLIFVGSNPPQKEMKNGRSIKTRTLTQWEFQRRSSFLFFFLWTLVAWYCFISLTRRKEKKLKLPWGMSDRSAGRDLERSCVPFGKADEETPSTEQSSNCPKLYGLVFLGIRVKNRVYKSNSLLWGPFQWQCHHSYLICLAMTRNQKRPCS